MTTEIERRQQIEEGRRLSADDGSWDLDLNAGTLSTRTLSLPSGHGKRFKEAREAAQNRPQAPKRDKPRGDQPRGHEAYLEGLRSSGAMLTVKEVGGETIHGKLKSCDKFTITLIVTERTSGHADRTYTRVFFKHALAFFGPAEGVQQ